MQLVLGLGNPEAEYLRTRHNLGHRVLDALFEGKAWTEKTEFFSRIQQRGSKDRTAIFANTLVSMNESGKTAAKLLRYYKVKPSELLVVHDDADIPFGKLKLSFGSRSAGHKGVESIIRAIKTKEFWRLRIGIQPNIGEKRLRADKLILEYFSKNEEELLPETFKNAHRIIAAWLEESARPA